MERIFCRKVHNSKWAQISDGVNNKKYHLFITTMLKSST